MKNFVISLLVVILSFVITTFILNGMSPKESIEKATSNSVINTVVTDDSNDIEEDANNENEPSKNEIDLESEAVEDNDYTQIVSSYRDWRKYQKENIILSTDFIALDNEGNEINKKEFLEELNKGGCIPVKRPEEEYMYQIFKFDSNTDERIAKSIKSIANITYNYYLKEGNPFPAFNFKDINGNAFSKDIVEGKLLVINCWYVTCKTCTNEFPKLNKLYDKYEAYEDIVFLSLAFDEAAKLKSFLSQKEFRYSVIADQKNFLLKKVKVKQFPTHIIVDEYGNILNMVNNADELSLALSTILNGSLLSQNI